MSSDKGHGRGQSPPPPHEHGQSSHTGSHHQHHQHHHHQQQQSSTSHHSASQTGQSLRKETKKEEEKKEEKREQQSQGLEEYDSALELMDKPTDLVSKRNPNANPKIKSCLATKSVKSTLGKAIKGFGMVRGRKEDLSLYNKLDSLCSTESIDDTSDVKPSNFDTTLELDKPYLKSLTDMHPKKDSSKDTKKK